MSTEMDAIRALLAEKVCALQTEIARLRAENEQLRAAVIASQTAPWPTPRAGKTKSKNRSKRHEPRQTTDEIQAAR